MNIKLKALVSGLTMAIVGLSVTPSAEAGIIQLYDGTTTLTIVDQSLSDQNSNPGIVSFIGTVGVWTFTVSTGRTKPAIGSATDPEMRLNVTAESSSGGYLLVRFTEDNFGPSNVSYTAGVSGANAGNVAYTTFVSGNPLPAQYFTPGTLTFAPTTVSGVLPSGNAFYPLAQVVEITHTAAGTSNVNATFSVPDGGWAMTLLGFGLIGLEGLRRKFAGRRA